MGVKITSFLSRLVNAIEDARVHEKKKWDESEHFHALENCLEEANSLLQFELTRAPTQQENKLQVSPDVGQRRVTRQTTETLMKRRISLPDEVLDVIFSYFRDTLHDPTNLSSNAYNFSLVCRSWHRVANGRLWRNIHLSSEKCAKLFARSLHEGHQLSSTLEKGSQLSIGESIRELHVPYEASIHLPLEKDPHLKNAWIRHIAPYLYVFDCVKLFTKNIVSLNLLGLSTPDNPMELTKVYEIIEMHPHLKHVWLCQIEIDSDEPLDPLPQFETFDCGEWRPEIRTVELISAKAISFTERDVFQKDAVKSLNIWNPYNWKVLEFKQVTHLHIANFEKYDDDEENYLLEAFDSIVQTLDLSFLVFKELFYLTSGYFDLIAKHCSLTAFVIKWQPGEESIDSWIASIQKMGPKLLSIGVGLDEDEHRSHTRILRAIYENCPNLRTLELYGVDSSTVVWSLEFASELENLCRLPLKWIYAPWFKKWPKLWEDTCPKFAKLCRLGLNVGLHDFPANSSPLLDYTQSMRPAIVGDGFCLF